MLQSSNQGQSDESIQQNIKYFGDNLEAYNNNIQKLDTYITLRSYIIKPFSALITSLILEMGAYLITMSH